MPFNRNLLGDLRPNQIITTFGPGSIVDAVKDSVTVLDTNCWKEKGKKIIDGRLASYLGVDCFYMPRTSANWGDVPVVAFPYTHICSKCGRIFDIRDGFDLQKYLSLGARCPDCGWSAYPSRFITICENGHMDDFPWSWWVHRGNNGCDGALRISSSGDTSTLADMHVRCTKCNAWRSMSGATQKENFEGMVCKGHHPFRPHARNERCGKQLIPSQRGASNVYFPVSRSAISIPPWINPLFNLIDEHLRLIEAIGSGITESSQGLQETTQDAVAPVQETLDDLSKQEKTGKAVGVSLAAGILSSKRMTQQAAAEIRDAVNSTLAGIGFSGTLTLPGAGLIQRSGLLPSTTYVSGNTDFSTNVVIRSANFQSQTTPRVFAEQVSALNRAKLAGYGVT